MLKQRLSLPFPEKELLQKKTESQRKEWISQMNSVQRKSVSTDCIDDCLGPQKEVE